MLGAVSLAALPATALSVTALAAAPSPDAEIVRIAALLDAHAAKADDLWDLHDLADEAGEDVSGIERVMEEYDRLQRPLVRQLAKTPARDMASLRAVQRSILGSSPR
jgi:hypothetical protein